MMKSIVVQFRLSKHNLYRPHTRALRTMYTRRRAVEKVKENCINVDVRTLANEDKLE